jgi:D-ribose pyranose/furanose isomerase RbsD
MRSNRILHLELAKVLSSLGHSDILMVTDTGFPIPINVWRIDLGCYEGLPGVLDILRVLRNEIFVEAVHFATEVRDCNQNLYAGLQEIFTASDADFKHTTHEALCQQFAPRAKVIIRSGSFNPWANIAMEASTDPLAWFTPDSGTKILPAYIERRLYPLSGGTNERTYRPA